MKYIKKFLLKVRDHVGKKYCLNVTHEIIQIFNEYLEPHLILMLRMTCKAFTLLDINKSADIVALIVNSPNCRPALEVALDLGYPISEAAISNTLSADSVAYMADIMYGYPSTLLYQAYMAKAPKCAEYVMSEMLCWRCSHIDKINISKECSGHKEVLKCDLKFLLQSMLIDRSPDDLRLRFMFT